MSGFGVLQVVLYFVVLIALAKPLGAYMAHVYEGKRTFLSPVLGPSRAPAVPPGGVAPTTTWTGSATRSRCCCSTCSASLVVYALQRLQDVLPLNPQDFGAVSADSSFNTAVSFATNTNWQGYGGESTMSYLTQMLGLGVQNFLSAATGMAVLVALIRGFVAQAVERHRQFLGRPDALDALHPAAAVADARLVLVSQGVVQTFSLQDGRLVAADAAVEADDSRRQGRQAREEGDDQRADAAARPGRLADRHQAARHQRRRLLQRQLGASVREPDAALEFPRDAVDPADLGGALLHLRPHDRRYAPGLGAARRDDAIFLVADLRGGRRRSRRAIRR